MVIDGQNNLVDLKNSQGMRQVITKSGKSDLTSDMNKVTSGIVFIGQGNGHGLGMSQWGARGMAQKGSTYQEIIEHYYNQDKYDGSIIIEKH